MSLKSFTTSATKKEDGEGWPFEVDGRQMVAYKPDEGQFAMLMANVGRGSSDSDRVAGLINFVINIIDDKGADYLVGRLYNRKDVFGIEQIEEIMEWLVEEWTGNPTQGQSASTPSPSSTGRSSTGPSLLSR